MSDFQRLTAFITSVMANAKTSPVLPPTAAPSATNIAVSRASNSAVLA